jgi:acetylornithine deacetylase
MSESSSLSILRDLVGFPTVSRDSNLPLIDYIEHYLKELGISGIRATNADGRKANLLATIGSATSAGILLSGHTDVVPVEGQNWSTDPFVLRVENDRAYGRGTADMKGFIACTLTMAAAAARRRLERPIHLSFSYDEEIGCVGVRTLLPALTALRPPALGIIGEPTNMKLVIAHKGKVMGRVVCTGVPGHSSDPDNGANAISMAGDVLQAFALSQMKLRNSPTRDQEFNVPFTTLHVGSIHGGTMLNVIPASCSFEFEIRNVPADDTDAILGDLRAAAETVAAPYRERFSTCAIDIVVTNQYPALSTNHDDSAMDWLRGLVDQGAERKVAFGSEAGLLSRELSMPAIICGPGSVAQAHRPDEFVTLEQLHSCDRFLARVLDHVTSASNARGNGGSLGL